MNIKEYRSFEFKMNNYCILKSTGYYESHISYVGTFLHDSSGRVYRKGGPLPFLDSLYAPSGECGMGFDMIDLNVDTKNDLIYLGEIFDAYEANMTDEEFNIKYNNMNALQLCQNNIVECAVMTKDNFVHLFNAWKEMYQNQSPFVLLYQDDNDWYDVLPFESQETMEEFIAAHTQQENK